MQKKFRLLLLSLICSVTFVSCNETPSDSVKESESTSESVEATDSSTSSPSEDDSVEELDPTYNELPNWQIVTDDINIGGDMLDIEIGRDFMTGAEYDISFSFGSSMPVDPSKTKVVSSNEKVFEVIKEGASYKVKALHAGKAYLRIYDSNGMIRYCNLVVVKDAIPLDYMEEYLVYDCEYWVSLMSWTDNYSLTFNEGGVYTVSGYITNESFGSITGTYEYVGETITGKEYEYKFTDTDITQLGLTGFHVAKTGTWMYLQDDNGTAAMMVPNNKIEDFK